MRCWQNSDGCEAQAAGNGLTLHKACNKADTLFYRNPQGRFFFHDGVAPPCFTTSKAAMSRLVLKQKNDVASINNM